RRLLLSASRSAWLARQLSERAFFRRAVRRFLPGEELGAALDAAAGFARDGIGSVLTELGEQVTTRAEGSRVRDHYLQVLDRVRQRGLPAQISVKLTHLGLDVDRAACLENVRALAARAADAGSFLWIDMEEARYVDVTLELFRRARAAHAPPDGAAAPARGRPWRRARQLRGAHAVRHPRRRAAGAGARRRAGARAHQLRDPLVSLVHAAARRAARERVVCGAASRLAL